MQLLEYFIEKLLTTQNCTLEIIKALLGPEAAHLAASYGIEGLKGTRNLCLRVNHGHRLATVMVVVVKTPNCIKTKTVYPHPVHSGRRDFGLSLTTHRRNQKDVATL